MRQKSALRVLWIVSTCASLLPACGGRYEDTPQPEALWPTCGEGKRKELAAYCTTCDSLASDPHTVIERCEDPSVLKVYAGCSNVVVERVDGETRRWSAYSIFSLGLEWVIEETINDCRSFGVPDECDEWVDLCEQP